MTKAVRILLAWTLFAGAAQLFAGIHPVGLPPNPDSKICIECHEDKAKGKFVHSAIAMGCTSCHEVRSIKGVTRVKLTTTTTQALCITHAHNVLPLDAPPFALHARTGEVDVAAGVRIGITKAIDLPWRYGLKGSKFLSKPFPDQT